MNIKIFCPKCKDLEPILDSGEYQIYDIKLCRYKCQQCQDFNIFTHLQDKIYCFDYYSSKFRISYEKDRIKPFTLRHYFDDMNISFNHDFCNMSLENFNNDFVVNFER